MRDRPRLAYDGKQKVYYVPDPALANAAKRRREFWEMVGSSIIVGTCISWVCVALFGAVILAVGTFVDFVPRYGLKGFLGLAGSVALVSSIVLIFKIADKKGMI